MNKKILFYFNSMTPAGGIERVIATLANQFCEFLDVTILVKDNVYSHFPLDPRVKIESLNNEIKFNLDNRLSRIKEAGRNLVSSRKLLKKYLTENKFDYYYLAHPLNALEFHLSRGVKVEDTIITEHGGIDAYNKVYKQIKKWLYPKSKCYIVPTKTDVKLYKELGFPALYIPHFKSKMQYAKNSLDSKIAITIGRMTEAKRQWILIDLWHSIVYKYHITDWQLYIVGDGNLKEQYLEKIEILQLQDYVKILPPRPDVEKYYREASFFLLTSHSEGFGMVILEAMSFGIPCISYDCPSGPRDMITNELDGFLVEYDNFEELEKRTLFMINNDRERLDFGSQAYLASKKWDDPAILKEWKQLLN